MTVHPLWYQYPKTFHMNLLPPLQSKADGVYYLSPTSLVQTSFIFAEKSVISLMYRNIYSVRHSRFKLRLNPKVVTNNASPSIWCSLYVQECKLFGFSSKRHKDSLNRRDPLSVWDCLCSCDVGLEPYQHLSKGQVSSKGLLWVKNMPSNIWTSIYKFL